MLIFAFSLHLNAQENSFRVMTYNVHLFDFVGHFVGHDKFGASYLDYAVDCILDFILTDRATFSDKERGEHIANKILEHDSELPDVLVFTELWSDDLADKISERLGYQHSYRPPKEEYWYENGVFFSSGMFVLSKHPIDRKSINFKRFDKLASDDLRTEKGVGTLTVRLKSGREFGVIFAHTQADYGTGEKSIVLENIREIFEMAKIYVLENRSKPLIVTGDFNIVAGTPDYHLLSELFLRIGMYDTYRAHFNIDRCDVSHGATYDPLNNKLIPHFSSKDAAKGEASRIDYVFFRPGASCFEVEAVSDIEDMRKHFLWPSTGEDLSDHYPLKVGLSCAKCENEQICIENLNQSDMLPPYCL